MGTVERYGKNVHDAEKATRRVGERQTNDRTNEQTAAKERKREEREIRDSQISLVRAD